MNSGNIKMLLMVLLGFLLTGEILSQDKKVITLEESIQTGLANSHFLHSSKMDVVSTQARLSEINSLRLPSLKLFANYTRLSDIDPAVINTPIGDFEINPTILNNYTARLSLQQPIFTGFRLSSSSKIAEYNSRASEEQYTQAEDQLIFDIKNAYWTLFRANKLHDFVNKNVLQMEAHLKDAENLLEQGLLTNNDVLKIQVQLSEAKLRQIDAANAVKLSALNLSNTIQIPVTTELQVADGLKYEVNIPRSVEELLERAYKNRPEIKAMNYRLQAGESGVTLAQSNWYPQLFLAGNYTYARPNQRIFPMEDRFKGTWDVSLNLQFDIWNWGQTADQTTQAEAQLEQVKDNYEIIKDAITLEVTQNYLNILQAIEKIDVAANSVTQAEENYRISNEKFKYGLLLSSEMLDAETALLQANTNHIQALVDYEMAKAKLQKSTSIRN